MQPVCFTASPRFQAPRLITLLMRLVVGGVFIFSGFVKAVDTWGGYYKITEYVQALGWESLLPMAVFLAFAVAMVEFVLGVLLAVGAYRRMVPAVLLALMVVLTPLTLWLAVTNAVPDCGCFGEALHMSNWATFGKNVLLVLALVYLLRYNKDLPSVYGPAVQWMVALWTFAFIIAVAVIGYSTQPLIDYRPYAIGTQLVAATPQVEEEDYVFVYERDGVQHEFYGLDSLPDDDDPAWTFVQRYRRPSAAAPQPADSVPQAAVAFFDGTLDVTAQLLGEPRPKVILLMPDLPRVGIAYSFVINELADFCEARDVAVWAVAAGSDAELAHWNDIAMAHYPIYQADDSEVKMLARGNAAVMYVDARNVVQWKRTLASINPSLLDNAQNDVMRLNGRFDPDSIMMRLFTLYMVGLALLLIVNRGSLALWRLAHRGRKATPQPSEEQS